jgi:outer membrane protein assembly factor BamB
MWIRFVAMTVVLACFAPRLLIAQTSVEENETKQARQEVQTTKHSFIGFGKANGIVIVDENDEVEWQMNLPASDAWMLESGNILAAIYPCKKFPKGGVCEIVRESKELVWEYQGQQKEISSVQKIGDDEYLVAELGETPRAIVINRAGKIQSEMAFDCQKKNAHMQTRMLRLLPNGNYIAPHLLDFAVKEYEPATGKVVKVFATDDRGREKRDWPFTAIRLQDGNTVIGCTNGNRVIEVDPEGKIVWSVDNTDLGENLIDDACGVQRLPNDNTVITSYHAKGDKVKLTEVDRDKRIVWRFDGLKSGFHHFQILTTNGESLDSAMK